MSIKKVLKKNKKHLTKFLTRIIVFSYRTFETKNKKISSNGEKKSPFTYGKGYHIGILTSNIPM